MQYTLTSPELAQCEIWTDQRQDPKTAHNVPSLKISDRSDRDIHRLGVWAEHAFSQVFGVPMHQLDTIGGDGGEADYKLLGLSVSLKAVFPGASYLIVPRHQYADVEHVDILVMLRLIEPHTIEFVGWTTGRVFREHRVQRDFTRDNTAAKGLSYCMPEELLTPMQDLVRWMEACPSAEPEQENRALLDQFVHIPVLSE